MQPYVAFRRQYFEPASATWAAFCTRGGRGSEDPMISDMAVRFRAYAGLGISLVILSSIGRNAAMERHRGRRAAVFPLWRSSGSSSAACHQAATPAKAGSQLGNVVSRLPSGARADQHNYYAFAIQLYRADILPHFRWRYIAIYIAGRVREAPRRYFNPAKARQGHRGDQARPTTSLTAPSATASKRRVGRTARSAISTSPGSQREVATDRRRGRC